jgi:hypothetical protein
MLRLPAEESHLSCPRIWKISYSAGARRPVPHNAQTQHSPLRLQESPCTPIVEQELQPLNKERKEVIGTTI